MWMEDYLKTIKPGNVLVIQPEYSSDLYYFAKVLQVDAKKIKTDKGDFSAVKGYKLGKYKDYYHSDIIQPDATIAEAEQWNREKETEKGYISPIS